mgnify:CR=1 FL=1
MLNQKINFKRENVMIITAVITLIVSLAMLLTTVFDNSATVSLVSKSYLDSNEEKMGKVIVKYVDTFGNEIADVDEVNGKVGEEYSVDAKKIEYYTLQKSPLNRKGNFDVADQIVNFIYTTDTSTIDEKSDGKNVVVTVFKNKNADELTEYKIILKTVDEDGNSVTGTSYQVKNINNMVEKNVTDYTGTVVIGSYALDNTNDDVLKISETKVAAEEYIPQEGSIDLNIDKSYAEETNTYSANFTLTEKENVSMAIDNDKREIVITTIKKLKEAPKPPETGDPDPEPDPAEQGIGDDHHGSVADLAV